MQAPQILSFLPIEAEGTSNPKYIVELSSSWRGHGVKSDRSQEPRLLEADASQYETAFNRLAIDETASADAYLIIIATTPDAFILQYLMQRGAEQAQASAGLYEQARSTWLALSERARSVALNLREHCQIFLDHSPEPLSADALDKLNAGKELRQENCIFDGHTPCGDFEHMWPLLRQALLEDEEVYASYEELLALSHWYHPLASLENTELRGIGDGLVDTFNLIKQARAETESQSAKLEEALVKNGKLKEVHQLYKELEARNAELIESLKEADSDSELQLLQIAQLQEELEVAHLGSKQLEEEKKALSEVVRSLDKKVLDSDNALAKAESTLKSQNEQLATVGAENELQLLQIAQLQEELEATFLQSKQLEKDKQGLAEKLAEKDERAKTLEQKLVETEQEQQLLGGEQKNTRLADEQPEQLRTLQAENEMQLLQIAQLQEELEHYYIAYQEALNNSAPTVLQAEMAAYTPSLTLLGRLLQ